MYSKLRRVLLCGFAGVVIGCQTGSGGGGDSALTVSENTPTRFVAFYSDGEPWATAEVGYTATTTFWQLRTSFGTTLAYDGAGFQDHTFRPDTRADHQNYVHLTAGDAEYKVVTGFLAALEKNGATATPSALEKGSTKYAATYMVARVLGRTPVNLSAHSANEQLAAPKAWPYPGYDDPALLPPELKVDAQGHSVLNGMCCGPTNCLDCQMLDPTAVCDDWCAAGDHCNAWHPGSDCGSLCPNAFTGCMDAWDPCPHSDGAAFTDWYAGCNPINYCNYHNANGF